MVQIEKKRTNYFNTTDSSCEKMNKTNQASRQIVNESYHSKSKVFGKVWHSNLFFVIFTSNY